MYFPRWIVLLTALAFPASAHAQWAQVTITSPADAQHFTSPNVTVT